MNDPVKTRPNRRREVLMERLDEIVAMQAMGEGSTTRLELTLLEDELRFLRPLYEVQLLAAIRERWEL